MVHQRTGKTVPDVIDADSKGTLSELRPNSLYHDVVGP